MHHRSINKEATILNEGKSHRQSCVILVSLSHSTVKSARMRLRQTREQVEGKKVKGKQLV